LTTILIADGLGLLFAKIRGSQSIVDPQVINKVIKLGGFLESIICAGVNPSLFGIFTFAPLLIKYLTMVILSLFNAI